MFQRKPKQTKKTPRAFDGLAPLAFPDEFTLTEVGQMFSDRLFESIGIRIMGGRASASHRTFSMFLYVRGWEWEGSDLRDFRLIELSISFNQTTFESFPIIKCIWDAYTASVSEVDMALLEAADFKQMDLSVYDYDKYAKWGNHHGDRL